MERDKVEKRARLVNILTIVATVIYWIIISVLNALGSNLYNSDAFVGVFIISNLLAIVIAIGILIFAIITAIQMKKANVNGGVLMVISSIIFLGFTLLNAMIGVIVFILSSISIRKINESPGQYVPQNPYDPYNQNNTINYNTNTPPTNMPNYNAPLTNMPNYSVPPTNMPNYNTPPTYNAPPDNTANTQNSQDNTYGNPNN